MRSPGRTRDVHAARGEGALAQLTHPGLALLAALLHLRVKVARKPAGSWFHECGMSRARPRAEQQTDGSVGAAMRHPGAPPWLRAWRTQV